jgi:hypothetical protein
MADKGSDQPRYGLMDDVNCGAALPVNPIRESFAFGQFLRLTLKLGELIEPVTVRRAVDTRLPVEAPRRACPWKPFSPTSRRARQLGSAWTATAARPSSGRMSSWRTSTGS